jgi:ribose transport system substrate-binding protein
MKWRKSVTRKAAAVSRLALAALVAVIAITACGGGGGTTTAKKTYNIYLSNNFIGNDWRVQMEKIAAIAATKGPLAGRAKLTIVDTSQDSVTEQIQSLNNIMTAKPDAILLEASSPDGLNSTLQKACDQGIVVVSFNETATAPCAWKIDINNDQVATAEGQWMATVLTGKGNIFQDQGLAGAPSSLQFVQAEDKVLQNYPDIHVVCKFNGQYALGPEQSGVASCLAGHPHVDGVFTLGNGTGAMSSLQAAGQPLVPTTAYGYNATQVACAQKNVKCFLNTNPPWASAEALKLAINVLDKTRPNQPQFVQLDAPFLTSTPDVKVPGATLVTIELGKTAFPDLPGGLTLPVAPPWLPGIAPTDVVKS